LLVHRPRTVHSISHRCAITEITITFLLRLLLGLVFSFLWVERESEFAFLILFSKSLSNGIESDTRESLVFLVYSKEQLSPSERVLLCIVDSWQMRVLRRTCTDRKVSATSPYLEKAVSTRNTQQELLIVAPLRLSFYRFMLLY